MKFSGGDVLAVVERVPLQWLPASHRQPMRDYLERGILPLDGDPLRLLLEGNAETVRSFARELPDMAALLEWVETYLQPCCWGNRDQAQLWCVYVRRAHGRLMLASFEEGNDGALQDLRR